MGENVISNTGLERWWLRKITAVIYLLDINPNALLSLLQSGGCVCIV